MKLQPSLALLVRRVPAALGILALLGSIITQVLPVSAQTTNPSFVRIIHASPEVGTADVFVDGKKLLSSFQFGAVTDYVAIPAGPHKVQIALVGKGIGASAITQTLAVSPGVAYTVAAVGTKATGLSLEVFIDNNLVAPGTAKLRVYQLSPNAGSINVATQGKTITSGVNYQQAGLYLALPQGSPTFNVIAPQVNATLSISATLKTITVTSIFVVGMFNSTPKLELVLAQTQGLPGLPGTGSDPTPTVQPATSQPLLPWFIGALAFLLIGSSLLTRRLTRVR
jgi:Domain of unknown function (DUF4397)